MPMNGMPPMPPGGQQFGSSPETGPVGQGQPPGGPPMPPGGMPPGGPGAGDEEIEGAIALVESMLEIPGLAEPLLAAIQARVGQGQPGGPPTEVGPGGPPPPQPGGMPPGGAPGGSFSDKAAELMGRY